MIQLKILDGYIYCYWIRIVATVLFFFGINPNFMQYISVYSFFGWMAFASHIDLLVVRLVTFIFIVLIWICAIILSVYILFISKFVSKFTNKFLKVAKCSLFAIAVSFSADLIMSLFIYDIGLKLASIIISLISMILSIRRFRLLC
jgi:hypothetical protein